jgi:hypothetical protein
MTHTLEQHPNRTVLHQYCQKKYFSIPYMKLNYIRVIALHPYIDQQEEKHFILVLQPTKLQN